MEVFRWFYLSSAFADWNFIFLLSPANQWSAYCRWPCRVPQWWTDAILLWTQVRMHTNTNLTAVTYHVVELRCGVTVCISSTAHPHRLHTDAVLLPFTLLLFQHQLIHTQTHLATLCFFLFSLYFCIFIGLFSPSLISPSRSEEQKRCPLCEVIFPPHYDQSKFEEHVESHWKICPLCGEQFPLDCDQELFEKHVLTHFDSNMINF